jgi:hypothetical protein
MTASARYLYCVLPAYDLAPAVRAPALDGGPVHPIRHRDVAVLTHACAPEPYQGSETEVRGWIAAHNAVIEEAWKSAGTVLPMSFDVIVRGDSGRGAEANVAGWLSEHHAALRSRLQALRGRVEVGVQILRDAEDSAAAAAPAGAAESASLRPRGHAYFARHQRQREQRERLELQAEAAFRRHGEMLATLVDDVQVNRPRPVRGKMMVLNLSLLTDQAGVARVGDYLEQVSQGTGTEVRFTGPWPPYSFAGTFARLKLIAEPARKAAEAGTIGEIRQRAGKYVRATE